MTLTLEPPAHPDPHSSSHTHPFQKALLSLKFGLFWSNLSALRLDALPALVELWQSSTVLLMLVLANILSAKVQLLILTVHQGNIKRLMSVFSKIQNFLNCFLCQNFKLPQTCMARIYERTVSYLEILCDVFLTPQPNKTKPLLQ